MVDAILAYYATYIYFTNTLSRRNTQNLGLERIIILFLICNNKYKIKIFNKTISESYKKLETNVV